MQVKGRKTYRNDHLPIILPIINYMVINSTCSSASWPRPVQWLLGAFDRRSDAQCNQKATKMWSLRASERRRGGRMRNRQSVGRRSKSNCEWNWSRRIDVETDEWLLCRFSFLPFFRLASRSLIGPVVVCIFNSKIILFLCAVCCLRKIFCTNMDRFLSTSSTSCSPCFHFRFEKTGSSRSIPKQGERQLT